MWKLILTKNPERKVNENRCNGIGKEEKLKIKTTIDLKIWNSAVDMEHGAIALTILFIFRNCLFFNTQINRWFVHFFFFLKLFISPSPYVKCCYFYAPRRCFWFLFIYLFNHFFFHFVSFWQIRQMSWQSLLLYFSFSLFRILWNGTDTVVLHMMESEVWGNYIKISLIASYMITVAVSLSPGLPFFLFDAFALQFAILWISSLQKDHFPWMVSNARASESSVIIKLVIVVEEDNG